MCFLKATCALLYKSEMWPLILENLTVDSCRPQRSHEVGGDGCDRLVRDKAMTLKPWHRPALGLAVLALAALASGSVLAHSFANTGIGFTAGFLHPPSGLDHLLAMVSVGIWGAALGAAAIWVLAVA